MNNMSLLQEKNLLWQHPTSPTPEKFEIKTPDVVVHVDPERADLVETRVIDGRKCLVIPMEGEVELNGIRVHTGNENPSDDEFYDNTDTETEETSDGE